MTACVFATVSRQPPGFCGSCVGPPSDIALLELDSPFELIEGSVELAVLAEEDDDLTGQECVITGWGRPSMQITSCRRGVVAASNMDKM